MSTLPLERYELFRADDLDHAREGVASVFCDHRLDFFGGATQLATRMHSRRLGLISVNYLRYGGDVSIDPGPLGSFYVVQVPLSGRSLVRYLDRKIFSTARLATVISPTEHLQQMWTRDCAQLILRIERTALHSRLRDMLGRPLWEPLVFEPEFDVSKGAGALWARKFRHLISGLDQEEYSLQSAADTIEHSLTTGLLMAQPHNYTEVLNETPSTTVSSRPVNVARELIEAHPEYRHSVTSLARAANVSERTLHAAFVEHLDMSPKAYLTDVRLKRAWEELRAAHPDTSTVAQIARGAGFGHIGRFSIVYRERFGEMPSDTLRR
ncbi:AraC family transcriptional regulator [Actinobacteria bacterium YIM 96077]|uniref:AraC family transcriptional regulator n=1 Tax=Phytoactinopolyspora halophila TaxID=1981511 RepID=A0A329QEL9_9ACTN|nr:AraC family transcriptional regulator [Phytoactinopolyspora halophila]AYY13610.1 AraC family transcriptional regulator [Actinobacteria bacterium YIM 96077]RAW10724.1 AraC family transcriptional regulator [Phytoactinopolyspora halophila]